MHSIVAYILSILAMPLVGLVAFLLTLPLTLLAVAGPAGDRAETFLSQALTAGLMIAASWWIFGWLDQPFTLGPVLVVGGTQTLFNVLRVARSMKAWAGWLEAHGHTAQGSGDALLVITQADDEARQLHRKIGDELTGTVGGLVGTALAGWWFVFA